jgi:hypothetical protein
MLATGLKMCGAVDAVVQSPFAQALNAIHQSDRYGVILAEKVAERSKVSSLLMPADLRREARAHLQTCGVSLKRPFALLHPGSGSRHKCMNPSIWRAVTQALNEQGLPSLLLEGPGSSRWLVCLSDMTRESLTSQLCWECRPWPSSGRPIRRDGHRGDLR